MRCAALATGSYRLDGRGVAVEISFIKRPDFPLIRIAANSCVPEGQSDIRQVRSIRLRRCPQFSSHRLGAASGERVDDEFGESFGLGPMDEVADVDFDEARSCDVLGDVAKPVLVDVTCRSAAKDECRAAYG